MPDSSNRQQDRLSTLVPSASIPALPRASTIAVIDPQASAFGYEHRRPDWPWIMVPEGETRTLTLGINAKDPVVLNGPAPDGTVELLHMNRCHVKLNGMRLQIRGMQSTRNIPIDLYQPGRYLRVWVSVKSRLDVHIIAHYVEHGPLLKTRISKEQLRAVIENANAILAPQANVHLVLARESTLSHERIGKRLGLSVEYSSDAVTQEQALLNAHKQTIPTTNWVVNLFLVRGYKGKNKREKKNPLATMSNDGCCIFEDHLHESDTYDTKKAGHTLAHEVSHYLIGANPKPIKDDPAHTSNPNSLMYPHSSGGTRLSRAEIEKMNPSISYVRQLPAIDPFGAPDPDPRWLA